MNQLNKNSYAVYIIHVIVLGAVALPMVHLPIPAMGKYLMLTVLTFVVSNLLVLAYQRLLQKSVLLKVATTAFPRIAERLRH